VHVYGTCSHLVAARADEGGAPRRFALERNFLSYGYDAEDRFFARPVNGFGGVTAAATR